MLSAQQPEGLAHLPAYQSKMKAHGLKPVVIDTFSGYFKNIAASHAGLIHDRDIRPVTPDEIQDAAHLSAYGGKGEHLVKNTVMVILNGGLGTSMGLTRAKSLLIAKNNRSFLEVILKQAETCGAKLSLMNSFMTHDDTRDALCRINPPQFPKMFIQHKFPKILQDGLAPADWPPNRDLEWNPPGHGDIYTAIYTSGVLQSLLDEGVVYAFISNSDNLGATLDKSLLGYFAEKNASFMMEVAARTPADIKGGHIARHQNGRFVLREAAQCPQNELNSFQDIHRYRFFNTNNIWINLKHLKALFDRQGMIQLPMILNPKTLDPRDALSPPVFQVETAMGSAIGLFDRALAIKVDRSRFFPVKKCNELLAVQSDAFVLTEENKLILNPHRKYAQMEIDLDPFYYGIIDLFNERFKDGIPSLVDCESLKVVGDVFFEKNIRIQGRAVIENRRKSKAVIKEGTTVQGDLILD
ncbi:MAG: UTP--glucose-1-phosphate uridylyltransferase [Desulfobacterales bacterium]|nr:UTP--glucose-1-phosphate uridylyltransferase [Desulfobacterales bacterium]